LLFVTKESGVAREYRALFRVLEHSRAKNLETEFAHWSSPYSIGKPQPDNYPIGQGFATLPRLCYEFPYRPQPAGAHLHLDQEPTAMSFLSEFRDFAMKGNVVDMAVGVVIGGAFTKIVNTLVEKVMTPPLGLLTGRVNFSEWNIPVTDATKAMVDGKEKEIPGITIGMGDFVNAAIAFTITALCLFLVVKAMNTAKARFEKKKESGAAEPPAQEKLLMEIRDLLKAKT
jgi:large conductance mechanosensitive channel